MGPTALGTAYMRLREPPKGPGRGLAFTLTNEDYDGILELVEDAGEQRDRG